MARRIRRPARPLHPNRSLSRGMNAEWRRRHIILPEKLDEHLFEWHGGQDSYVYALASTGMHDLVSLSMIDAALEELDAIDAGEKDDPDLESLKGELQEVRIFFGEHSAEGSGMDVEEYDYDVRDYGVDDESQVETMTGNPPARPVDERSRILTRFAWEEGRDREGGVMAELAMLAGQLAAARSQHVAGPRPRGSYEDALVQADRTYAKLRAWAAGEKQP